MPMSWRKLVSKAPMMLVAAVLALGLCGCPRTLSVNDPLSPATDVRVTKLAAPGGSAMLAPIVSAGAGAATTSTSIEFPAVDLEVTVFNGVQTELTAFGVTYYQEDGTALAIPPLSAPLTVTITPDPISETSPVVLNSSFTPATVPVPLQLVSTSLRSFIAGPDALLGTADDYASNVVAVLSLAGRDVNSNTFTVYGRISITARPQVAATTDQ